MTEALDLFDILYKYIYVVKAISGLSMNPDGDNLLAELDDAALSPEQRDELCWKLCTDDVFHWLGKEGPARRGLPSYADDVANQSRRSLAEVTACFRSLERAGCGKYVVGRRGNKSRFRWRCSPKSACAKALALSDAYVPPWRASETGSNADLPTAEEGEGAPTEPMLEHTFLLRSELPPLVIRLPVSFTRAEATRVATFITSLPFGE